MSVQATRRRYDMTSGQYKVLVDMCNEIGIEPDQAVRDANMRGSFDSLSLSQANKLIQILWVRRESVRKAVSS